ncbi:MAG: tRNA (adenosine(37)-N6)-threonylcarbamoyltransferase complex dimerization subunit type 1 TsaB [Chthoniobacterales bacterium]
MKVLALELSSGEGSIAWRDPEEERFAVAFANDRKHSGPFFEKLHEVLRAFGRPDRIVVGLGPGSYAGTRIAISTAIGLQAASGAELIGLPSVCAMPTETRAYCVIGDARRQSFFFAQVIDRRCVEGPMLYTRPDLEVRLHTVPPPLLTTEPLSAFPDAAVAHPSAAILAQLASFSHSNASGAPLQPLYLREAHITQPRGMAPLSLGK